MVCKNPLKEGETSCVHCGFDSKFPFFFSEKQAEEWKENAVAVWKSVWLEKSAAGIGFFVFPKEDGTVTYIGIPGEMKDEIERWSDIVSVAAGNFHALGLKKDGTVVAAGKNHLGQCNVTEWKNIVSIANCGDCSLHC